MPIREFTFDSNLGKQFINFGYELYKDDAAWIPPMKDTLRRQLSPEFSFHRKPGNSHRHFLMTNGEKVIGRVSAFVNRDLKDHDGIPVGSVGFFDCIEDYSVAQELLDVATNWLRVQGISRVWGPMNFDIWHAYRFMTKGFEEKLFYGEPYNKRYYPEFFERYGFTPKQRWDSAEMTGNEKIQKAAERGIERYRQLIADGFRFEEFDLKNFNAEVEKLHAALCSSFKGFLGFTPITFPDFLQVFRASRHAIIPRLFRFVYDPQHRLIGFTGAFLELSDAVRSMNGSSGVLSSLNFLYHRRRVQRIMFHLGGSIQESALKKSGLGRAAFSLICSETLNLGYGVVLVTLMAERNAIHGLLSGQARQRGEYTLYELNR